MGPLILTSLAGVLVIWAGVWNYRLKEKEVETTLNTITGGDSLVYLHLGEGNDEFRQIPFAVNHYGSFTTYNIEINLYYMDENWKRTSTPRSRREFSALSGAHPSMTYPDYVVGWMPHEANSPPKHSRFAAIITARNGVFVQYIKLDNLTDTWRINSVVFENGQICGRCPSFGNVASLLQELRSTPPDVAF